MGIFFGDSVTGDYFWDSVTREFYIWESVTGDYFWDSVTGKFIFRFRSPYLILCALWGNKS